MLLSDALRHMNDARFFVSIALLDCCRDYPIPKLLPKASTKRSAGGGATRGGMAPVEASALKGVEGSIVGFATASGQARSVLRVGALTPLREIECSEGQRAAPRTQEAEDSSNVIEGHSPFTAALLQVRRGRR